MHVNLPEFLLYPQFLLLLSDNVSMAEYHKAYFKVDLNPVGMTIQAFFRIWYFFLNKMGNTSILVALLPLRHQEVAVCIFY